MQKKRLIDDNFPVDKLSHSDIEYFLKEWNIKYPYDRLWRSKYKIPFHSKAHLEISPIDIYLDITEDKLIEKIKSEHIENLKNKEEYLKTGSILKERIISSEEEDKLLKNFKFPTQE
jgi:hypothetical protein